MASITIKSYQHSDPIEHLRVDMASADADSVYETPRSFPGKLKLATIILVGLLFVSGLAALTADGTTYPSPVLLGSSLEEEPGNSMQMLGSSKGPEGPPKPKERDWDKIMEKGKYDWQKCQNSEDPDCWKNEGDRVHTYWHDFGKKMKTYWSSFGKRMDDYWANLFGPKPEATTPPTDAPPPTAPADKPATGV